MNFLDRKTAKSIPITPLAAGGLAAWLKKQDGKTRAWVKASGFGAEENAVLLLPDDNGGIRRVLFGAGDGLYAYAALPEKLPANGAGYYIDAALGKNDATRTALGWALGCYDFDRYKKKKGGKPAALVWPGNADKRAVRSAARATFLVRDLINIPANDLGPAELAQAAAKLARAKKATIKIIEGDALLKQGYPMIHAVGKGSPRAPRLIDMRWGKKGRPLVALVGKGVVFDTGGLNLKPGNSMDLMKKDMGGAAHVLGLAQMIMDANLPVRLRVLIPAVENAMDGKSFRPGDVLQTRKGITVEIGNTDAEGRLVLADALAEASREKPALIVDYATLTGAARVALGPDLPAMFTNDERTAVALAECAREAEDPLWRLPLWQPYTKSLSSKVADVNNIGGSGFAGAITAALFLEKFVGSGIPWVHFDTYGWMPAAKPGRPAGGEALGMRAGFEFIRNRFGKATR